MALAALLVVALNDHWWKAAWPSWWTGKLSDVGGMVFFPLFLQGLWEVGRWGVRRGAVVRPSRRVLFAATLVTGLCFGLAKSWEPAAELYRWGFGAARWMVSAASAAAFAPGQSLPALVPVRFACDPTDLLALPFLWLAWKAGLARTRAGRACSKRGMSDGESCGGALGA